MAERTTIWCRHSIQLLLLLAAHVQYSLHFTHANYGLPYPGVWSVNPLNILSADYKQDIDLGVTHESASSAEPILLSGIT